MLDSELMEKGMLAVDNIADGDLRKRRTVGHPVIRIAAPRAGRPVGGPDRIRADDEVSIGVDCPAGSNQLAPGTFRRLPGREDHVGPARVAMQYEHHIALVR